MSGLPVQWLVSALEAALRALLLGVSPCAVLCCRAKYSQPESAPPQAAGDRQGPACAEKRSVPILFRKPLPSEAESASACISALHRF
jgi:hypothetical protein